MTVSTPAQTPDDRLPAITRPNGKIYRPRKLAVQIWDNDEAYGDHGSYGVFVIGTHDVSVAEPLASDRIRREWYPELTATRPRLRWVRLGYLNGEQAWVDDEVRGRAAVEFTADYPAEERAS